MTGGDNPLSKREQEILTLVAQGLTNQEIARDLVISPNTVKVHLRNIFAKLEAASRTEATVRAAQAGWIRVSGLEEEEQRPAEVPAAEEAIRLAPWQRVYFLAAVALVLAALLVPGLAGRLEAVGQASDLSDSGQTRLGAPPRADVGRWQSLASMPTGRSRLALAEVNGLLFAIGGEGVQGITGVVEVYDPRTNGWLRRLDKPTAAANVQAAVWDEEIFLPGGTTPSSAASQQLEIYDPAANLWRLGAQLPKPVTGYALAALDGRIFLFGGWDGSRYVDTVLAYNVAAGRWEERSPLPAALGFAAAAAIGDRVLVVGGFDGLAESADCGAYYPAEDRWEACAPLILPRGGLGLAVDGTSVYAIGGGWQRSVPFNERYDSLTSTWSSIPSPVPGQWRALGVANLGSAVYAVGGWSGDYLAVNEAFQGTFRAFLPLGSRGQ